MDEKLKEELMSDIMILILSSLFNVPTTVLVQYNNVGKQLSPAL